MNVYLEIPEVSEDWIRDVFVLHDHSYKKIWSVHESPLKKVNLMISRRGNIVRSDTWLTQLRAGSKAKDCINIKSDGPTD